MGKMLSYTSKTFRRAFLRSMLMVYYHKVGILTPYIVHVKNVIPEYGQAKLREDKDFSISSHCCLNT